MSAGEYGSYLDKLVFSVDPATGVVQAVAHSTVDVAAGSSPDPEVQAIVEQAVADSAGPGSVKLRRDRRRVQASAGRRDRRQPGWRVHPRQLRGRGPALGHRRADRLHEPRRAPRGHGRQRRRRLPRPVTYRQAAGVQPFANTLVTVSLAGAPRSGRSWSSRCSPRAPRVRSSGSASRRASSTPTTRPPRSAPRGSDVVRG